MESLAFRSKGQVPGGEDKAQEVPSQHHLQLGQLGVPVAWCSGWEAAFFEGFFRGRGGGWDGQNLTYPKVPGLIGTHSITQSTLPG